MAQTQTPANAPAPTELATKPADSQPQNAAAPADQAAAFRAELKRFTEKFGAENGTRWFMEGKTCEQALELHAAALAEQLAAKDKTIAELHQKLAAVPRGEAEPVSMSTPEQHPAGSAQPQPQNKYAYMGNIGKFAQSIKLPAAKAS
jgi:hypothetical protein